MRVLLIVEWVAQGEERSSGNRSAGEVAQSPSVEVEAGVGSLSSVAASVAAAAAVAAAGRGAGVKTGSCHLVVVASD